MPTISSAIMDWDVVKTLNLAVEVKLAVIQVRLVVVHHVVLWDIVAYRPVDRPAAV